MEKFWMENQQKNNKVMIFAKKAILLYDGEKRTIPIQKLTVKTKIVFLENLKPAVLERAKKTQSRRTKT